ncbi:MAG: redox-regulated ATPase YchF [Desulfobacterales bacterium]|nr:redox-regulated ATPase YchF [Desulfobacterales bacterium]
MKLGIIGLPQSGKTTIFEALTQTITDGGHTGEARIGTIRVPDQRVDILSEMYKPKKTIYAQVQYFIPAKPVGKDKDSNIWTQVRDCDALIHVIRNFGGYGFEAPNPLDDFIKLDQEMIFSDLVVVEKRLERIELEQKRGKKIDQEEISLLNECAKNLEQEIPLRRCADFVGAPLLRGYAFISAKPMLVLFNNEDEDDNLPNLKELITKENCNVIRGKLEHELAQMSDEEAEDFLTEFNITASAMDRVIHQSYELLNLISFFTVGEDEVKAWTIRKKTPADEAAGVIHSDIQKGFIRAEVLAYNDLMDAGTYQAAKKKGTVRLEGKTYEVQDGDIINFRFNV